MTVKTLPPQNLQQWLDAVTQPFPNATALPLRQELQTHYEETLDALREAGHPNAEAEALRQLGDAGEVQRALEQTHYTATELEWLKEDWGWKDVVKPYQARRMALFWAACMTLPVLLSSGHQHQVFSAAAYWLVITLLFGGDFVIRRSCSAVSGAVMVRVIGVLAAPLAFITLQVTAGLDQGNWQRSLVEVLAMLLSLSWVMYLLRPRAALGLFRKALRNAR